MVPASRWGHPIGATGVRHHDNVYFTRWRRRRSRLTVLKRCVSVGGQGIAAVFERA